jgi:ABC-type nitrate/sulfonate/bicarbonate transport system permease component
MLWKSPLLPMAALALLWEIAGRTLLAPWHVLPPPSAILATLWQARAGLYPHLATTSEEALGGFLWGNAVAILLALTAFLLPVLEPFLARVMLAIYCLPLLVLAPILQIVFSNLVPMVVLSGIFVLFTTFIATLVGLREVDAASLLVVRACGGSKWDELWRVRFVAWLPSLIGGLSQAAPAAVVGAMVGEYMGSTTGLGVAMIYAQTSFQVERTWAICLLATSLALLPYGLIQLAGWWLTPWARDQRPIVIAAVAPGQELSAARTWWRRIRLTAIYLVGAAIITGVWYALIALLSLDPYFAKTPGDLWSYLTSDPDAAAHRALFLPPTAVTLTHAGGGLLLGFGAAFLTALGVRLWHRLEGALTPYLVLIASVPVAAMVPVISLLCGRGAGAVMVAVALLVFVPSFITILVGFKSVPEQATSLVRVAGGSWWRAVGTVQLPFALPWLIAAFKAAAPIAIGGSLLGEWLITGDGLALVMQQSRSAGDYTVIWTAGLWVVLLSLGIYTLIAALETRVLARLHLRGA